MIRRIGGGQKPVLLQDKWDGLPNELKNENVQIHAALAGKDGNSYLFYGKKYLRFATNNFSKIDNGYPRTVSKFWGKLKNNIERTCKVDAALVVESYMPTTISFNHKFDKITVPHTRRAFAFNNPFSIELWIKPLKYAASNKEPISLIEKGDTFKVALTSRGDVVINLKGTELLSSNNRLKLNSWTHLCITHNGQELMLYFDNTATKIASGLLPNNTKPLVIAGPGEEDGFIGFMDDIRVWKMARTIQQLNRFEKTQLKGSEPNLSAYFGMQHSKLTDFTGNSKAIETYGIAVAAEDDSSPLDVLSGPKHTYLFSDDQYYRYQGSDYDFVEPGYPKNLSELRKESRFKHIGEQFFKRH